MIWGKTLAEKPPKPERQYGDKKVKFIWFPGQLRDGRWVWWEWVECEWAFSQGSRAPYWKYLRIMPNWRGGQI